MTHPIDLYELMPSVYRREDASLGYPLEALLDIISTQAGHIQRDITGLWDDFFIETAREWAIPYIAELVGSSPLHRVEGSWRADVANTIRYRRRKGTLAMLEDLAGDVTGWGSRVVPFFELMEWTQHLDHRRVEHTGRPGRVDRVGTVNLGNLDALDRLDGPFDDIAHTADIRPFGAGRGRHNIKKIGFFLWRLRSNPLADVAPRASAGHPRGYHFSPLGNAAPLFTNDERSSTGVRASEADLPGRIRRLALRDDLEAAAAAAATAAAEAAANGATLAEQQAAADAAGMMGRYYGPEAHHSLVIAVGPLDGVFDTQVLPASRVVVCDLSGWRQPPPGKDAAVDPLRGRLMLAASAVPSAGEAVRVSYCYGFNGAPGAELGGGPYDRRASFGPPVAATIAEDVHRAVISKVEPTPSPLPWAPSIKAAIGDWLAATPRPDHAIIDVLDSRTYFEGTLTIDLPVDATLELRAANGERPVVDVDALTVRGAGNGRLVVDGFAVMGAPLRIDVGVSDVALRHTTLVPGRSFNPEGFAEVPGGASISSTPAAVGCAINLANAIVGPVRIPAEGWTLTASDTIIDSPAGETAIGGNGADLGPTCDLRRVTVLGDVRVRSILYASDVILLDEVEVERTQAGCIRFSYVRDLARTPRRYHCQPDVALASATSNAQRSTIRARIQPRFTSRLYGQPGYAQLATDAAVELRTGADNEAEMGAFNRVLEAQRIANLQLRLDEYLPAGLEPGLIFET